MKIPKFNPFPSKNLSPKTKPKNVAEQIAHYPETEYTVKKPKENTEKVAEQTLVTESKSLSSNKVNSLVKRYTSAKQDIEGAKLSKHFGAQYFNRQPPLGLLEINDYKRLVKEDIIDQQKADSLEKLDQEIAAILKIRTKSFNLLTKLEKLTTVRDNLRKPIQRKIEAHQSYLGKDIVNLRNKMTEGYQSKINRLDQVLTEVRKYPEVEKALKKLGLIGQQEFSQELREKVLKKSEEFIKSLDERHELALDKITDLIGEDLESNLLYSPGDTNHQQQSAIDKARNALVKAILEKKTLRSPKQVVPWLIKKETYVDKYWQVFNFISEKDTEDVLKYIDTEEAKKLLEARQEVIRENKMFQQLFGKNYISPFWRAFQTREENQPRKNFTRQNFKPATKPNQGKFSKTKEGSPV